MFLWGQPKISFYSCTTFEKEFEAQLFFSSAVEFEYRELQIYPNESEKTSEK